MTRREAERQTRQADTLRGLGFTREEGEALRRISMTLQRWFEQECGDSNPYGSWCIVRGYKTGGVFTHDDDGKPFMEHQHWTHGKGKDTTTYEPLADRETGARRRLDKIVAACNDRRRATCGNAESEDWLPLQTYIQTDPRGAALYIIRPGDVPQGQEVGSYYTRGICVY